MKSAARADSLNGGDGICVSSTCCCSVQALSFLMMSSAARTLAFDDGIASCCAASGDTMSAEASAPASVICLIWETYGKARTP